MGYAGPLRDEPLALELHNTIYATSRGAVDGLADPASRVAWLEALAPLVRAGAEWPSGVGSAARSADPPAVPSPPAGGWSPTRPAHLPHGPWPSVADLVALREVVRRALQA